MSITRFSKLADLNVVAFVWLINEAVIVSAL